MDFGMFTDFHIRPQMSQAEAFEESFQQVEAAEQLGMDAVWLAEHHFSPDRSVLASPQHVRRVRQTAGAGRADFAVLAYLIVAIGRDGQRARAAVRPLIARYLGALHGQSILLDAGLEPERTRPFREALGRGAPATELVDDALIDALAVAGTPEHCRRQLARWAEAGLDAPIAVLPREADMIEQIALYAETAVPAWKALR